MNKCLMLVAAMMAAMSLEAQTERSDDFKAKYELKEVVVMSRHNIRSPLTSGGAAYMRVTPYEWFKWTSPSSQLSQRGGVLETEMGQFIRKWVVNAGLLPDNYRPQACLLPTWRFCISTTRTKWILCSRPSSRR